jgi:hypothetical protein
MGAVKNKQHNTRATRPDPNIPSVPLGDGLVSQDPAVVNPGFN